MPRSAHLDHTRSTNPSRCPECTYCKATKPEGDVELLLVHSAGCRALIADGAPGGGHLGAVDSANPPSHVIGVVVESVRQKRALTRRRVDYGHAEHRTQGIVRVAIFAVLEEHLDVEHAGYRFRPWCGKAHLDLVEHVATFGLIGDSSRAQVGA